MSSRPPQRILVADDHPDAADATAALLRLDGFEALAAYDGLQALQLARSFKPDLVILDIDMPGMDGYKTARALRQEQAAGSPLVLIAHTGRTQPSDQREALAAGFDHHVPKPLRDGSLGDVVRAWLPPPPAAEERPARAAEPGTGTGASAGMPPTTARHPGRLA